MYEVDKTRTHDDSPSHDEEYNAEIRVGIFVEFDKKYKGTCTAEVSRFEEYYTKVDIWFI